MAEIQDPTLANRYVRLQKLGVPGFRKDQDRQAEYQAKADKHGRVSLPALPGPYQLSVSDTGQGGWEDLGDFVVGGWSFRKS